LLRELAIDVVQGTLRDSPAGACMLFGGHRGCGKSTGDRRRGEDRMKGIKSSA
jgi:hypothetical protein